MYKTYVNHYYNPTDTTPKPGDNQNWEDIQRGFYRVGKRFEHTEITVIEVLADSQNDNTHYSFINYNDVKDKIGNFINYPQILVLRDSADNNYRIFYPVAYNVDGGAITAQYASLRADYYQIGGVALVRNDDIDEWGIIVQPFN